MGRRERSGRDWSSIDLQRLLSLLLGETTTDSLVKGRSDKGSGLEVGSPSREERFSPAT